MFEDIRIEQRDGVGWLWLARAERRNAVRPQTLAELCQALDQFAVDPDVRGIVLIGEGKHFCAGAEFDFLKGLKTMPAPAIKDQIYAHFQGTARRLYHSKKPTLAAVKGAAVTVGCELAAACDFRLAGSGAQFMESWIKLGLMPPLGGLFLLPRLIGLGRAAEMCLSGKAVDAEEAERIGLVSEVVAPDALEARAAAFMQDLIALPPLAYASVKEALQRGLSGTMEGEWSANVNTQSLLLGTDDFAEGLAAVQQRRPGVFTGH